MRVSRLAILSALVAAVLLLTTATGFAAPAQRSNGWGNSGSLVPQVRVAEKADVSPALRSIVPQPARPGIQKEPPYMHRLPGGLGTDVDPVVQREVGPNAMPAPIQNFEGVNNLNGVYPPDTQGDVGPNHYVQWVNLSFAVYSKTGATLYGPAAGNTLWTSFGGACETSNDGDPITLYDPLADRWLMAQFALPNFPNGPFYECIAISTTPDPTGSWYRYAFQTSATKMDDYPKFGVWPDAYYMTANLFQAPSLSWAGEGAYAFDRTKMLTGDPTAAMIFFELGPEAWGGALPSDLDGQHLPPAGAPNLFLEVVDDAWDPTNWPNDALLVRAFHVDFATPGNSTYNSTPLQIPVAAFDGLLCNFGNCVPQPGTSQRLDVLGDRMMFRVQYRNFGDHDALVVNHTVDVGTDLAGIRWYELRDLWTTPTLYQQGTYAPADGLHRWMGSIAQDHVGNMALGFSTSNATAPNYPSIAYTGRLVTDPLGQMPQGEGVIMVGSGSQTGTAGRWGDYSMMAVDPVDDCTFWYTQEYVQTTGGTTWRTRIASFMFPSCVNPTAVDVSTVVAAPAMPGYALAAGVGLVLLAGAVVALRLRARRA